MSDQDTYLVVISTEDALRDRFLAAHAHALSIIRNGARAELRVQESTNPVSVEQFRFFHGPVLRQISEQVRDPSGQRYTADVWKRYFKNTILERKPRYVQMLFPGAAKKVPVRKWWSLKELGMRRMSLFIDEVIANAQTDWGVVFHFKQGEREAARYEPPMRKERH